MKIWKRSLLVLGIAAAAFVPPAAATHASEPAVDARRRALQGRLDALVGEGRVAGAVGLVARDGEILFRGAAGAASREAGRPMTPDHLFRIASMTKPITSVGVMILYEEGRIALDDDVSEVLPAFAAMRVLEIREDGSTHLVPTREPITVRHLLTHTSGLNYRLLAPDPLGRLYDEADVQDGLERGHGDLQKEIERLAALPLTHHPGESWTYGLSTDVLGAVIEVVSGTPLDAFLESRIFEPLGMHDTGFFVPESETERLATLYRATEGDELEPIEGRFVEGRAHISADMVVGERPTYLSGGGGLVSSADDYFRFAQMILNGGELDGVRILERDTVELMTRNQIGPLFTSFDPDKFGLGFSITTEAREGIPEGVLGWGGILGTEVWIDPASGIVALFMSQVYDFPRRDAIVRRFGGEVFRQLAPETSS